jgi:hypothetical protein
MPRPVDFGLGDAVTLRAVDIDCLVLGEVARLLSGE